MLHSVNESSNIKEYDKTTNTFNDKSYLSNKSDKTLTENTSHIKNYRLNNKKYRELRRNKNLFDSLDEEDAFIEETVDIFLSPNSMFIKIFDVLLFL